MNAGHLLTIAALAAAAISLVFRLRDAMGAAGSARPARIAFTASGIAMAAAMGLLAAAFVTENYSYAYVYNYSSRDLPLAYKIAGLWAGQQGTFLLWAFVLYAIGTVLDRARAGQNNIVVAVLTVPMLFILLIIAMPDYSPFRFVWDAMPDRIAPGAVPADGAGLNPLLQNFWMISHPPVLFIGYAAATVPFAYAIAALVRNDFTDWAARAYPWALFTMVSLGIGIFLGGYWAYTVLGWGGYWGWDPVENSSLVPWLSTVALVHGLIVHRRKRALVKSNIALALVTFVLVFYSTFLTRSGVLSKFSVHSFGDLGLSAHLLVFIAATAAGGIALFLWRRSSMTAEPLGESLLGLDNLIACGVVVLCGYAAFILIGTSMPILSRIVVPEGSSVKAEFYNNLSIPAGLLLLALIIAASRAAWPRAVGRWAAAILGCAAIGIGIALNVGSTTNAFAYLFAAFGSLAALQALHAIVRAPSRRAIAARIAHCGVGVLVVGFVTSNLHSTTAQRELTQGATTAVGPLEIVFDGITGRDTTALAFTVRDGGRERAIRAPYFVDQRSGALYREPFVIRGLVRDVYIAPAEYRPDGGGGTRLHLEKGKPQAADGTAFEFLGFDTKLMNMMAGAGTILAEVRVRGAGGTHTVSPGLIIENGKAVGNYDAALPGTPAKKIALLSMNVSAKEIHLLVTEGAPPSVLVDISFKRLIWLVWLGTVAIAAGGIVGLFRSRE
ncbi:MAG TPA: cytochrome c biogenesis protein CcsA [Spirochaetota bacterium]|nr:cytochrome c biogenesis protein CcsA [Spirochaetota bacterium]HOS38527.1 cytochrome c biogenesis protein CcsA [Spirochaetota bacterium]HPU89467.1 cytochrome c biogenesis protein CcsA [Spirochaetota bacterium]